MKNVKKGDITVEITNKNVKNFNLRVCPPNGIVKLSVPYLADDQTIENFISSKLSWIKKHKERFSNLPNSKRKEYITNEKHSFLGNELILEVIETSYNFNIQIQNDTIRLFIWKNSSRKQRKEIVRKWYRISLNKMVQPMLENWQKQLNVRMKQLRIIMMKTKWGSCTPSKGTIVLNLELIKKPKKCIEYVVVHELIHLLESSHNERFYKLLTKYLPNWKESKKELQNSPIDFSEWID